MPAFAYDQAIQDAVADYFAGTFKLMLVTAAYAAAKPDTGVDTAAAAEIAATGYVGGFGGAGRKTVALTLVKDTTANIVRVIFPATVTWTALGGATNATIAGAVLIREVTSDALSRPVAWLPLTAFTTNGSGFQLTFDQTNGNLTFSV
jgi:hypothetical protein